MTPDSTHSPGPGDAGARSSSGGPTLGRVHRILLETARQLGSSLEPDAIFARLRSSVSGAMRCDGLIVSSFDRATQTIRCSYACVDGNLLDPATLPPLTYKPEGGGMQTQVIRTGKPMSFSDVLDRVRDPQGTYYEVDAAGGVRKLREAAAPPKSQSALMVPLVLEGEVVGVVQVMADAPGAYGAAELELLEGISLLLAVALENARLYRRAQDELEERRHAERVLREAEAALSEADRRKDEFLATLGHELRNPLNPIRLASELMRRREGLDAETQWAHGVIERQVTHLARLIDDLLDVGRITQGKLELRREVIELGRVLDHALETVRDGPGGSRREMVVHAGAEPLWVDADPVRLGQVFGNLLDNAAKYTTGGEPIEMRVEPAAGEVVVTVSDGGIGIAPEHLHQVFDAFYQADHGTSARAGLGIGLTLVRRIVEMHGGSVSAASDGVGRGSVFAVRLPLASQPAPAAPHAAPAVPVSSPPRRRILVADDNRDSAESMAELLRMVGHEVVTAFDGQEALALGERFRPDVLVLDIGMPLLDGHEVARRVRERPWGRVAILVAATGWGQDSDRRRSTETGFDAHLVKPIALEALFELLEDVTQRRSEP